jgi:hypothetical protein
MSINLVTYANQTVTPTNDAIIYERAIDQNGIFYGCNVTVTSNTVNITGGYGIICGREFVINSDSLTVTLAPSGTLDGRLYVRLDLADADAPIQLLTVTGNTLPALTQDDDVNYTNGVYEMELATFTVGVSALSDVVETFETIVGAKADYIVEQGTDGIWTYRKWNSGIAECWGRTAESSLALSTAYNGAYYGTLTVQLPSELFISAPLVTATRNSSSTGVTWLQVYSVTTSSFKADIGNNTSVTVPVSLGVEAKGTWK